MNKFAGFLLLLAVAFVGGWICAWCNLESEIIEIKTSEVRFNTITQDVQTMSVTALQEELACFYTSTPSLDIEHRQGQEYELSAGLCGRRWSRQATIKARDSPRHMITVGPFIDTRVRIGGWAQYYRLYGSFGIGGGLAYSPGYAQLQGGVLFLW